MRKLSARRGQYARGWRTYTKREVKRKCNTPKISGSEWKSRTRDKMLDWSVVSSCNMYAGVQPELRQGLLTVLNGAHHDTPRRQKENTSHCPPKLVSAKALRTSHISQEPIRGRTHLQAATRRTLVPHDRCRGSNAGRPVARRDMSNGTSTPSCRRDFRCQRVERSWPIS